MGCQSARFKSKVLAWVVASAISPAPDPAIAEGEAKRLMQQAKQVRIDLARAGNDEKKVAAMRARMECRVRRLMFNISRLRVLGSRRGIGLVHA